MERCAQRCAGGRGRRADTRAGARRRLRGGCGRRLARAAGLGRDRPRGVRRGAGAGGGARPRRRGHRGVGARGAGGGGADAGVVRPGLRAVPGAAAHAGRRGRARAARSGRTGRGAAGRAPRGDGHPPRPRQRVRPGRLRLALDGDRTARRGLGRRAGRAAAAVAPPGGAGAHHADDVVLRAGCAEDPAAHAGRVCVPRRSATWDPPSPRGHRRLTRAAAGRCSARGRASAAAARRTPPPRARASRPCGTPRTPPGRLPGASRW